MTIPITARPSMTLVVADVPISGIQTDVVHLLRERLTDRAARSQLEFGESGRLRDLPERPVVASPSPSDAIVAPLAALVFRAGPGYVIETKFGSEDLRALLRLWPAAAVVLVLGSQAQRPDELLSSLEDEDRCGDVSVTIDLLSTEHDAELLAALAPMPDWPAFRREKGQVTASGPSPHARIRLLPPMGPAATIVSARWRHYLTFVLGEIVSAGVCEHPGVRISVNLAIELRTGRTRAVMALSTTDCDLLLRNDAVDFSFSFIRAEHLAAGV